MFGYVIINKNEMKFKEYDIYHSFYCGLCQVLKKNYGMFGQMTLNYDMTFAVLLLTSLYEPETISRQTRCVAHPLEKHLTRENIYTDYAADMNILLSYYKCMDDWNDEKKVSRYGYAQLLKRAYLQVYERYPEKGKIISTALRDLAREEEKQSDDIDRMAGLFGQIMSEVFAFRQDEWSDGLRRMGFFLGKYIYILDAYEDLEKDLKEGRHNPLIMKSRTADFDEDIKTILTMMMAECSKEFEKLPIVDHIEILRNIIYSGVWYRYEAVRQKKEKEQNNA